MKDTILIKSKLYDYSITFIDNVEDMIKEFGEETFYVIDKNVYELYIDKFKNISKENILLMVPSEDNKNMDTVMDIIVTWKKRGVKKNWKIVCFGGGITQDVTTIASNLFLRNIEWYFFPTTLLAMCDSCIGGKCGINLGEYKNQIGVFYPPKKIYIDTNFINTLSAEDYINGWGELLKFSLTSDKEFYEALRNENNYVPCDNIKNYIKWGLEVKKAVIEEDEFESDLRRILNYGHTFGHALEAYTHNVVPHGKGVIWGIDVVNYIAAKQGLISEVYYLQIKNSIKKAFIQEEIVIADSEKLFEIIKTDKKMSGDILSFALLDGESHLIVYPIKVDEKLKELFDNYLEETHEYYNN